MKLGKALRGYYREQVDAVTITGALPVVKTEGRSGPAWIPSFSFHAALIGFIIAAMTSGYFRPSHLEKRMATIGERYTIEKRMVNSLNELVFTIKKGRSHGGKI